MELGFYFTQLGERGEEPNTRVVRDLGYFCFSHMSAIVHYVGPALEEINALHRSAGFGVLQTVQGALERTVGVWSPSQTLEELTESDWWDMCLIEEIEHALKNNRKPQVIGRPSHYTLEKRCPTQALHSKAAYNRAAKRALDRCICDESFAPLWVHRVLELTDELYDLSRSLPDSVNGVREWHETFGADFEGYYRTSSPVLIAWQPEDCTQQVYDQVMEQASQAGDYTDETFSAFCRIDEPETVKAALWQFEQIAPLIRIADEILFILHERSMQHLKPGEVFREYRVSKEALKSWREMWPDKKPKSEPKSLADALGIPERVENEEFITLE